MIVETLSLGELATNCYIIYDEKTHQGIVIDPADEATFIAEKLDRLNITLTAIVATHGHFDHNLGAGELQLITNVPYMINKNDLFLLKEMNKSASFWLKRAINYPLPQMIHFLKDNDTISFGSYKLTVIATPGHTPGSITFFLNNKIGAGGTTGSRVMTESAQSIIFSGDTLFKQAIGRYDFSYSSKLDFDTSLQKLFKLSPKTIVYPGHGEPTTIGDENTQV